jgi:hypothetical protein
MAAKPSVPHEQQITTVTKTNSIEANKKSVDNLLENHVENHKENTKPEINGHTVNGDEVFRQLFLHYLIYHYYSTDKQTTNQLNSQIEC